MNHVAKTVIFGLLLSAAVSGAQAAGHQHGEMMPAAPAAGQAQAISATGEVKIIDFEEGYSTTTIVERIAKLAKEGKL